MFDRTAFYASFDARIDVLKQAEKITKDTLRDLSRDLLSITHETEDIGFVNRTLNVLTPMNRKTAILFFKEFSGFKWSEEEISFVAKDKKRWDDIVARGVREMEDPHFNLWTWAEKNVTIEAKPFDLAKVTVFAKQAIKKAQENGIKQSDLLKAFFDGGFDPESLLVFMDAMAGADAPGEGEQGHNEED